MEKFNCIYRIHTNGMEYTGVSNEVETRIKNHSKYDDRKGRTMRKHGYTYEVLKDGLSEKAAYELEASIVDSEYVGRTDVLNSTVGGIGSFSHIHQSWADGTSKPAGMNDACQEGRERYRLTPEGQETYRKRGEELAESHGKKVLERAGHQSMASKARWEKNPVSHLKGKKYTEDEKQKAYPKATCPKCGQIGGARGIASWHGLDGSKCRKA